MGGTKPYKAVVSGVVTFCTSLGLALADGQVTAGEWLVVVPTTVLSVAAVYGITNPEMDR